MFGTIKNKNLFVKINSVFIVHFFIIGNIYYRKEKA